MTKANELNTCPYCDGQGYVHLLLGGTETCEGCSGSGKKQNTLV